MSDGYPTVMVNGKPVPGWFTLDGEARVVACPCGPDVPDDGCPYHGRHPYMVCDACNYETHRCPMCGDYVEHYGSGLCADDEAYLREVDRGIGIDEARS